MKKHLSKLVALLLAAAFVFAACDGDEVVSEAGKDTLVIAIQSEPVSLDPIGRNDNASSQVNRQMYCNLVGQEMINGVFTVVPMLAESWEHIDDTTVVFNLREGVMFHNGEELKASDIKFSLERALASSEFGFLINMIDEIEINSDYQITIYLEFPFAPFLSHLAHTGIAIVNEKAVTDAGDRYGEHPIGTGPLKFELWAAGDRVVMSRFDDYWGGPIQLREVTFRVIPEQPMRLIEVETGGVDIGYAISPNDITKAEANPRVNLLRDFNFQTNFIGMNNQNQYLADPLVRQAINYAVDTEIMIQNVLMGSGKPSSGPICDMVWGSIQSELEPFAYNLEKAQELMKEAGMEDGFSINLWYNTPNPQRQEYAEMVQAMLRNINIDVNVEGMDWATYLSRLDAAEHDMFVLGWGTVTGDPDYGLFATFHTSSFGSTGNRTYTSDPRLDELLEAGRTTSNLDERLEIYAEIQQIIRDLSPWIFINQAEELVATSATLRGFELVPNGHHKVWTVYYE